MLVTAAFEELTALATTSTIVTAILNHIYAGGHTALPGLLLQYVPAQPRVLAGLTPLREVPVQLSRVNLYVDELLTTLSMARRTLRAAIERNDQFFFHAELANLRALWQEVCGEIDLCAQACNLTEQSSKTTAAELWTALRDAESGRYMLDPGADNIVPKWAQRRQERRVRVHADAQIELRDQRLHAHVTDASSGGLGLRFDGEVELGDTAVVEFLNGRRLLGRFVWRNGERAGLEFNVRLAMDDALLSGV